MGFTNYTDIVAFEVFGIWEKGKYGDGG
jgi:hypothetical protein